EREGLAIGRLGRRDIAGEVEGEREAMLRIRHLRLENKRLTIGRDGGRDVPSAAQAFADVEGRLGVAGVLRSGAPQQPQCFLVIALHAWTVPSRRSASASSGARARASR